MVTWSKTSLSSFNSIDPGATVIETTSLTSDSTSTTTTVDENNGSLSPSDPTATTYNSNGIANGTQGVTILVGIGVAILIVLAAIVVVVTLVLLYLRKSSHPKAKSDYDNSYSTLRRGDTQQPQPHSQQPPTDLYDQIQLSPSTGQAEIVSKAETENTNTLSSHHTRVYTNIDKDHCNKISGQDNVAMSEQPTYAAVDNKQKKNKEEKKREGVVLSVHCADKEDTKKKIKQREATPTSLHTTESPEALYSVVKKKPKADKEETVPPPPPHSLEELYTAVKKNVKGSAMEEEEGAPQIPPHTIEELYTAVVKKPKGDSATESETDGAPPIPPHTVDDR